MSECSTVCVLVSAIRSPPSRKLGSLQLGLQLGLELKPSRELGSLHPGLQLGRGLELKHDNLVWLVSSLISRVELGLVLGVKWLK